MRWTQSSPEEVEVFSVPASSSPVLGTFWAASELLALGRVLFPS